MNIKIFPYQTHHTEAVLRLIEETHPGRSREVLDRSLTHNQFPHIVAVQVDEHSHPIVAAYFTLTFQPYVDALPGSTELSPLADLELYSFTTLDRIPTISACLQSILSYIFNLQHLGAIRLSTSRFHVLAEILERFGAGSFVFDRAGGCTRNGLVHVMRWNLTSQEYAMMKSKTVTGVDVDGQKVQTTQAAPARKRYDPLGLGALWQRYLHLFRRRSNH